MLDLITINEQKYLTKLEYVIEYIRNQIILGKLKPGERIKENVLKCELKMSSSPIREAIIHLEAEGLLTRIPHIGAKISELNVGDEKELYLMQAQLQKIAVKFAAPKLDEKDIKIAENLNEEMEKITNNMMDPERLRILNYKFHMVINGISIYPWLTRLISSLWIRLKTTVWENKTSAIFFINQHKEILQAIKNKNFDSAADLMNDHFESAKELLFDKK